VNGKPSVTLDMSVYNMQTFAAHGIAADYSYQILVGFSTALAAEGVI